MVDYYGTDCSFLKNKKLWLLDMDGTIYLGNGIFKGTLDFLNQIEKNGGRYVFLTNNSSKGKDDYVKKVSKMGIKADENSFYTSVDAAVMLLKNRFGSELIYAQGTHSFIKNLREGGLNVTEKYDENAKCVIVAFDTELTLEKLSATCRTLLIEVPYYATNPDWVCPTEFGYVPDCGSMCFGIEKATGKSPVYIGKPGPVMINEAIKKFGAKKEDAVMVGDRIYTDVASGVNAGVDTVLVLSGETTADVCNKSEVKPSLVLSDVGEIARIIK